MAAAIAKSGPGIFETYAFFMAEFYLGIVILWLLLFVAAFAVLGRRCGALFKAVREPTMLAFATASLIGVSPVFVTPDELGDAWRDGKVHLPLVSRINEAPFGAPDAGVDMTFSFPQLIAHAARTRRLGAGAIVGSGTVSNYDRSRGSSCLAEKRTLEVLAGGRPETPFLRFGDRVRIEMFDTTGHSIFGAIDQRVVRAS